MKLRLPSLLAVAGLTLGASLTVVWPLAVPADDRSPASGGGAGGDRPTTAPAVSPRGATPSGAGSANIRLPAPKPPPAPDSPAATLGAPTAAPALDRTNRPGPPAGRPAARSRGGALLVQAVRELLAQPALEARVRQRLWLYGHQFVGSGYYRQLGPGPDKFLLWELKMQFNDEITSLKQVSDRRYLWIHRNFPHRTEQGVVDLRQIRESRPSAIPTAAPDNAWLAVGGLGQLLQGLDDYFDFAPARADKLGEHDVWVLEGRWKPARLAHLLPEGEGVSPTSSGETAAPAPNAPARLPSNLPPHLPQRVMLVLGRDPVLPLFPYRIEFQREAEADSDSDSKGSPTPLLRMEFFEIRRASLTPEQFVFDPGDNPVVDETDRYLQLLGREPRESRR